MLRRLLAPGCWTLDFGPWTLDFGLWTLDFGLWTLDFKLRRRPPIEHLETHGNLVVVLAELRGEREVKTTHGQRAVICAPKDGVQDRPAVGHPDSGVLLFGSHTPERAG